MFKQLFIRNAPGALQYSIMRYAHYKIINENVSFVVMRQMHNNKRNVYCCALGALRKTV